MLRLGRAAVVGLAASASRLTGHLREMPRKRASIGVGRLTPNAELIAGFAILRTHSSADSQPREGLHKPYARASARLESSTIARNIYLAKAKCSKFGFRDINFEHAAFNSWLACSQNATSNVKPLSIKSSAIGT